MKRLLHLAAALPLAAAPQWKAPEKLAFGRMAVLELVESDPAAPPLPRPGDENLGPLALRGVEATKDGRGWKLTVQPLVPGLAVVPPLDLGDGRRTPELRLEVPRTTPYGADWKGVGGGLQDRLEPLPFPWMWATLAALPFLALGAWILRRVRKGGPGRAWHQARRAFLAAWPPRTRQRPALDHSHGAGRDILARVFGEEARTWGPAALRRRQLDGWAAWAEGLDAARFGGGEPPRAKAEDLLQALEAHRKHPKGGAP
jgi:hypothetical protein